MPVAKSSPAKPSVAKPAIVKPPAVTSTPAKSATSEPFAGVPSKAAVSAKPITGKLTNSAAVSKPALIEALKEVVPIPAVAATNELLPAPETTKLSTPKEHLKAESVNLAAPPPVIYTPVINAASASEPILIEAPVSFKTLASNSPAAVNKMVKFMDQASMPFKGYEDIAAFNKANIDAVIQANQILARGIEDFSKEVMSISKSSVESATSAAKAMFAVRSLKEMMELNAEHTKSMFDNFMSNSTKLSEMSVKVATDAMSPVTARVQLAVEKAIKPSAAPLSPLAM